MALPKSSVANNLAKIRKSRGVGAAELSRRVGISRQTIYAIEAGTYVPNTEVALRIARELEVTVDELFTLGTASAGAGEALTADLLGNSPPTRGQPVRICQVGGRWVSVPVPSTPLFMPAADGVVKRAAGASGRADLMVFAKEDASHKRLLLAGCDPATGLLSSMVERASGVEVVTAAASSKLALKWLKEGKVHIAGSHLEDPASGEFNLPYVREMFPGEEIVAVTFARWEEGLVVRPGNPKGIRQIENLTRRGVRFINREPGSGSRALLDKLLAPAGIAESRIKGYEDVAYGHLPASYQVLAGDADVCIATRSAARNFGLDFLPLHSARYDLILRRRTAELPAIKDFLDVLQRAALRRKLEVLAGYDTAQTGTLLAV